MRYTIENEFLSLSVDTHGAEPVSVISKTSGRECIWCGDAAVWGRHAPILFPYTGKLTNGVLTVDGKDYKGGQHGFARDFEHALTEQSADKLVFTLDSNEATRAMFPFDFRLVSVFELQGKTIHHTLRVENPSEAPLSFGIGYHPAFVVPFDDSHDTEDYEFRFDEMESPICIDCRPNGLISGKCYYLASNTKTVQLTDALFDNDSFCMTNLKSSKLGIYEKDTGRGIVCTISGFPYTLIWSKRGTDGKLPFVCIEPWHSLPGIEGGSTQWSERAAAAILQMGEVWSCCLSTEFDC